MSRLVSQRDALVALGPVAPVPHSEVRTRLAETLAAHTIVGVALAVEGVLLASVQAHPTDEVVRAYQAAYPGLADSMSPDDKFSELWERGEQSLGGFIHGLRGKLFEQQLPDALETMIPGSHGWRIAADPTQPLWDLVGVDENGAEILVQAKARVAESAGDVIENMEAEGAVELFAVTRELAAAILRQRPDLAPRLLETDITTAGLDDEVRDSLESLAQYLGVDVPDSLTDVLPYVGEVVLGLRLLLDVAQNEKLLKTMPRDDRNRMHAVRAATLLARFGVTSVCMTLAGAVGTGIGTALPGPGNAIGALSGLVAGAVGAGKLNKHVQPRLLELGMRVGGVEPDDIFYHSHKAAVDGIGETLRAQREAVANMRAA